MDKTRCIIVPLNENAMIKLNYGLKYSEANDEDYRVWRISQDIFDNLWHTGIFQEINSKCDSLIDDYEDECIKSQKLSNVLKILEKDKYKNNVYLYELKKLVELARTNNTCVDFAF